MRGINSIATRELSSSEDSSFFHNQREYGQKRLALFFFDSN